jgi:hypothetical protein
MAQSETTRKSNSNGQEKGTDGSTQPNNKQTDKVTGKAAKPRKPRANRKPATEMPSWLGAVISAVGVGVAVGAGLYATRHQWMPKAGAWKDDFSAAFADDETDYENFDQTRHAGLDSMRDHPGDDWSEVDDMSDASFPASDPPSFTPGTAS